MEEYLKKFLELQKEKAERDEQSNAIFKAAIEEILTPVVEQPETPPVEQPEPTPIPNPDPAPTLEEPVVSYDIGGGIPKIVWIPLEGASYYKVMMKSYTQISFITAARKVTGTEFTHGVREKENLYTYLIQAYNSEDVYIGNVGRTEFSLIGLDEEEVLPPAEDRREMVMDKDEFRAKYPVMRTAVDELLGFTKEEGGEYVPTPEELQQQLNASGDTTGLYELTYFYGVGQETVVRILLTGEADIPDEELPEVVPPVVEERVDFGESAIPTDQDPTSETPVVYQIVNGVTILLKWLPVDGAAFYNIFQRNNGNSSWISLSKRVPVARFEDLGISPGFEKKYAINAHAADGTFIERVGEIIAEVPESDLTDEYKLPRYGQDPENFKEFFIDIDASQEGDLTREVNEKINAIPNGTPELYHKIKIRTNGEVWTEGDFDRNLRGESNIIVLVGKKFLIIEPDGEGMVTFYRKAPATTLQSGHRSKTAHFVLVQCNNVIGRRLRMKGANTIAEGKLGTTPEFTPHWWELGRIAHPYKYAPLHYGNWEYEHGFYSVHSVNCRFEDCEAYGTFGDGFYQIHCTGVEWINTVALMTGRQGHCLSNACFKVRMIGCKSIFQRRSGLDLEPYGMSVYSRRIDGVEIAHCYFEGRVSMVGAGIIQNINFHDNDMAGCMIRCIGGTTSPRRNITIKGNKKLIPYPNSAWAEKFGYVENLQYEDNDQKVHLREGWQNLISFYNCTGDLTLKGTTIDYDAKILIADSDPFEIADNAERITITIE